MAIPNRFLPAEIVLGLIINCKVAIVATNQPQTRRCVQRLLPKCKEACLQHGTREIRYSSCKELQIETIMKVLAGNVDVWHFAWKNLC